MPDYLYYLKKGTRFLILDNKTIKEVANDKHATKYALINYTVGISIATLVTALRTKGTSLMYIMAIIPFLVMSITGIFAVHLMSKVFGSKTSFIHYFRPVGIFGIFSIVTSVYLIPKIGSYIAIALIPFALVIGFNIVKQVYNLSIWKTIFVGLLTYLMEFAAVLIVSIIIGIIITGTPFDINSLRPGSP